VAGTRVAACIVAATSALAAACGGDGGSAEMRLVLTDDGCTYEGAGALSDGGFTAEVENQTSFSGAFALASLAEGSTTEDLEPYLAEAGQQLEESGALPELPPFYEQVVRSGVEAGATGSLPADVPTGTYALMCFVDDLPTWRIYVAGQLDVTG
jgi:hypothetical protein